MEGSGCATFLKWGFWEPGWRYGLADRRCLLLRCESGRPLTPAIGDGASCSLLTNLSSPDLSLRVASHFVRSLQKFVCFSNPFCGAAGKFFGTRPVLAVRTIWQRDGGWECRKVSLFQGQVWLLPPVGCNTLFLRPKGKETGHRGAGRELPRAVLA